MCFFIYTMLGIGEAWVLSAQPLFFFLRHHETAHFETIDLKELVVELSHNSRLAIEEIRRPRQPMSNGISSPHLIVSAELAQHSS